MLPWFWQFITSTSNNPSDISLFYQNHCSALQRSYSEYRGLASEQAGYRRIGVQRNRVQCYTVCSKQYIFCDSVTVTSRSVWKVSDRLLATITTAEVCCFPQA
jgi:hypothetical protein